MDDCVICHKPIHPEDSGLCDEHKYLEQFKVWRVEERISPDGVDFWDFPSEEEARRDYEESDTITIRQLSVLEVVDTAVQAYMDVIRIPFYKE